MNKKKAKNKKKCKKKKRGGEKAYSGGNECNLRYEKKK